MAIKSTIFKANLQIADIDHGYYADHALTLARHPSETDERMMVRLVAMALQAHELQDTCGGDGTLAFSAAADVWWKGIENKLTRMDKLQVWRLPTEVAPALAALAERSMQLQATVQDGAITLSSAQGSVHIEPLRWKWSQRIDIRRRPQPP